MWAGSCFYYRLKHRRLSGLTATHGLNDFNAVAFVQGMLRQHAFRNYGSIDLDREALAFQPERADEHGQRGVRVHLTFFAVEIQFHSL